MPPDVGILRTIDRSELTFAPNATLEFFRRFLRERFFQRIGATARKNRAGDAESDREGLQARRILKKVTSDKWRVTSFRFRPRRTSTCHTSHGTRHFPRND